MSPAKTPPVEQSFLLECYRLARESKSLHKTPVLQMKVGIWKKCDVVFLSNLITVTPVSPTAHLLPKYTVDIETIPLHVTVASEGDVVRKLPRGDALAFLITLTEAFKAVGTKGRKR